MAILRLSAAALLMLSLNACVHSGSDCHGKNPRTCEMKKAGKDCKMKDCDDKSCKMKKGHGTCEKGDAKKTEMKKNDSI